MSWTELIQNLPLVLLVLISVIICGAELIKALKVWKGRRDEAVSAEVEKVQQRELLKEEFEKIHERFDDMELRFDDLDDRLEVVETRARDLTESDKNDIKAWIVEQYHKFYVHQGWIDAFSAETIEKRYEDYKKEGGNSYIEQLMERLRTLPMDPTDLGE